MFRFNRIACVVAVGALVSVAFAGAVRISDADFVVFMPANADEVDAMAILSYNVGLDQTTLQLITSGLPTSGETGTATYTIGIQGSDETCDMVVDTNGVATLHATFDGNFSRADVVITGPAPSLDVIAVGVNPQGQ